MPFVSKIQRQTDYSLLPSSCPIVIDNGGSYFRIGDVISGGLGSLILVSYSGTSSRGLAINLRGKPSLLLAIMTLACSSTLIAHALDHVQPLRAMWSTSLK